MPDQAFLRAGDEEGRDDRDAIDADAVEFFCKFHRFEGCRHAGIDDHLHLAGNFVDDFFRQPHLLLESQRGEVAVGSGAQDVVAGSDLAANLGAGRLIIDCFVLVEAGDEGDISRFWT